MPSLSRCPRCAIRHTPRCPAPRWPVEPLTDRLRYPTRDLNVSSAELARQTTTGLSDAMADRWAVRCGFHPSEVWPEWHEAGLTVTDDLFVNGGGWRPAWLAAEQMRVAS